MKKFLMIGAAALALGAGAAALAQGDSADAGRPGPDGGRERGPRFERLFDRFDADKDGVITKAEIMAKRSERFEALDADKDGGVTAEEMVQAAMKRIEERVNRRMAWLDMDGDGKLSALEFEAGRRGGGMTRFIRMDENGDGQITREEAMKAADRSGRRMRGRDRDHGWGHHGWGHHGHGMGRGGWGRHGQRGGWDY